MQIDPRRAVESHELFFAGPTSVHAWPVENGFKTQVAICKPCDPHLTPSCLISSLSDNISRPSALVMLRKKIKKASTLVFIYLRKLSA
jgi:hypothetical protein